MKQAVGLGRFPFKAPIGHINVSTHSGRNVIPDPKTSGLIKKAFSLAATGLHTKSELLRDMTKLDLQTVKGRALTPQSFHNLLRNPIYAGWVVIPKWGMKARGSFEALVDEGTFERVQDVLAGKRLTVIAHERNNPDFPSH